MNTSMKKILILVWLACPFWAQAQKTALNQFFDKYSGQEGYTSIYVTKYTFELFKKIENAQEGKEFDEVVTKLKAIKILAPDSATHLATDQAFLKELSASLPDAQYKDLMIVRDGPETISFMIREEGPSISEFVMTIEGDGAPFLLFLEGDIDLNEIAKLSRSVDINGFQHLDKLKGKN